MRRFRVGVALLIAFSCTAAPQNRAPLAFDFQPAPPWHLNGAGQATINADGDLVLEVSVRGPTAEVSRAAPPYALPGNIGWNLYLGDCAARLRDAPGHVLFGWYVDPQSSDSYVYTQVIPRGLLDPPPPYAVAAYRNGGGPLYACGDIPALPKLAS